MPASETGGDTLSMTLNLGYLVSTLIFATVLVMLVACQIAAKKFHPALYWATIIASTTRCSNDEVEASGGEGGIAAAVLAAGPSGPTLRVVQNRSRRFCRTR